VRGLAPAFSVGRKVAGQVVNAAREPAVRRMLAGRSPAMPAQVDCAIYFADEPASAYQVRQWLAPMAALSERHPVALLVHRPTTAAELASDSPLPVTLARSADAVEDFVRLHGVRVIFYVNNNRDNFSVLRISGPAHIHLSHGESDKISMASNQLKAYDYAFIAGAASRRRILAQVPRLDPARLVEIGRPQLDYPATDTPVHDGGRITVLYAPTWEGDRPAMAYGSLLSHGPQLARTLLDDPRYRLVFRPHPRSGSRQPAHRAAVQEISRLIARASKSDPGAGHYTDTRADFSAAMAEADVCICDISAMAMDWLPRRKPLLVARPVDPGAEVSHSGLVRAVPLLDAAEAGNVGEVVQDLILRPVGAGQTALIQDHFGDTSPGAATRRFLGAVESALGGEPVA
jgi:hypothetical protein